LPCNLHQNSSGIIKRLLCHAAYIKTHCERVSKSASLYFEKEGTKHACANSTQNHQSSRDGTTKLNRVNNFQNLEACRGEETTDVACREPLSHPKQGRTPTRMVQSKVTAITTQTAAGHEVPPEVPRQSKKRRVFVQCF
jgi:mediator of DNA damage checkpoint protein 1